MVKNLPAMQETQVQYLVWEDPLEKEMATPFTILGWRIPWTEEPGSWGCKELDMTERLNTNIHVVTTRVKKWELASHPVSLCDSCYIPLLRTKPLS